MFITWLLGGLFYLIIGVFILMAIFSKRDYFLSVLKPWTAIFCLFATLVVCVSVLFLTIFHLIKNSEWMMEPRIAVQMLFLLAMSIIMLARYFRIRHSMKVKTRVLGGDGTRDSM